MGAFTISINWANVDISWPFGGSVFHWRALVKREEFRD